MSGAPKSIDVLAFGINSTDTIIRLPAFPRLDSKTEILSAQILPGGQCASAAVACHRWGLRTRYVGKIGDDWAGRFQREEMAREGLETRWIEVPGASSQGAYILIDQPSGERTILWQHDPRIGLAESDVPADWLSRTRLLHVDGHPPAAAAFAARLAREAGAVVTADLDNLYPGVEQLLAQVDYLISSREFPARVTGIAEVPAALVEISRRFGCRVATATLGRDGVLAWDGAKFHYSTGYRVDAADTTGAGDMFHAAFAYALLDGHALSGALEFSCAAAALSCTGLGARGGIRSLAEIGALQMNGQRHTSVWDGARLTSSEPR